MSTTERFARRPGPRSRTASKEIVQPDQSVDPQIGELNLKFQGVPPPTRRGAPKGSKNRLVHGCFTAERQALWADARAFVREGHALVRQVREMFSERGGAPRRVIAEKGER